MKIKIVIETDDKGQEYILGPYGEREKQHESEVTIEIKNKESRFEDEVLKDTIKNS